MKTAQNLPKKKWSFVTIDPALNDYRDKVMFPEKLEQANKVLKNLFALNFHRTKTAANMRFGIMAGRRTSH